MEAHATEAVGQRTQCKRQLFRKNIMGKKIEDNLCKCGHRKSDHEHGRCRGSKVMQRYTDAETGEERKTPDMVEGLAPQCDCRDFTPGTPHW